VQCIHKGIQGDDNGPLGGHDIMLCRMVPRLAPYVGGPFARAPACWLAAARAEGKHGRGTIIMYGCL
jgi:hypothetical protein